MTPHQRSLARRRSLSRLTGSLPRSLRVWLAGVNWDDIRGTDRLLVEAASVPMIWVDRGYSPLRGGHLLPFADPQIEVLRRDPLLLRFTPVILPFATKPIARWLTPRLIRWQVRAALWRLGFKVNSVVCTYLTDAASRWPPDAPVVLYGTDDYRAGAGLMGISGRWLERLEDRCLGNADAVVAVSDELAARWNTLRPGVEVLRNGCRVLEPQTPGESTRPATINLSQHESPVVGLVGQISARISLEVLEAIADANMRLLIVGPVDPNWSGLERFAALTRQDSVEHTGRVDPSELPRQFARMDVGVTPYISSSFNTASFPLKTLEYLGAGLPVVASDITPSRWVLRDIEDRLGASTAANHLRLATDPQDFVKHIRDLVRSTGPAAEQQRRSYASHHSWESRVQELDNILARTSPLSGR